MLYQEQLVALLDRKFELSNDLTGREFFLELENFVNFITTNEQVTIFADQLNHRLTQKIADFKLEKLQLVHDLHSIRNELIDKIPQIDDSDCLPPKQTKYRDPHHPYYKSLACFDWQVQELLRIISEEQINRQAEKDYTIDGLVSILSNKTTRENLDDESFEYFFLKLGHIKDRDIFLRRNLTNYFRASPEGALNALVHIASNVNPEPRLHHSWTEIPDEAIKSLIDDVEHEKIRIVEVTYQGVNDEDLLYQSKLYLRRAYEGLRAEIGSFLIHSQIVQRYKARCTWYDRQRLESLISANQGNEEDALTQDLALYLFDNGISTLYRVRRGVHEYDLIGEQTKSRIFIEVKVYKESKDLKKGIAQLHSYLNGLEADNLFTEEVYYIVYRLGGPLYDLPQSIPTNRRIFYPLIIDLGSSSESGSRQPKPIYIEQKEFFMALDAEEDRVAC